MLRAGGVYLLWTPGKRTGPHDVTAIYYPKCKGFPAKGFHIREYTFEEVTQLGLASGFEHVEYPKPSWEIAAMLVKGTVR